MKTLNNSYLSVDLKLLRENITAILSGLTTAQLIPVLKSDAFGLGLVSVARTAAEFEQVKCLAVAHVSEGLELRCAGIDKDILVIGSAMDFQLPAAVEAGLTLTAARLGFLTKLDAVASALDTTALVNIKLDTGLHRIGVDIGQELATLLSEFHSCKNIRLTGTFSHFADSFDATRCQAQYELFLRGLEQIKNAGIDPGLRHISCSASSELYPQYQLDAIRAGRRLFFDNPQNPIGNIQEPASWRTFVTTVKTRHAGDLLGYGHGRCLERDSTVASIGVGYGDGLFPAFGEIGAPVLIHGKRCPLLYVSMDQSLVDVSSIDCAPGDEVTLFGHSSQGDCLPTQELASITGINEGCSLSSNLSPRVAKIYERQYVPT